MSLKQKIGEDMREALRSGDKTRLGVLRMLRSKIQEAEVERRAKEGPGAELDDAGVLEVLARYAKQRRESIESYGQAGREDLVEQERAELAVVESYLPRALDESELEAAVREAIREVGASSIRDMGAVMKAVMPRVRGRADGKAVNAMVRRLLESASP